MARLADVSAATLIAESGFSPANQYRLKLLLFTDFSAIENAREPLKSEAVDGLQSRRRGCFRETGGGDLR